MSTSVAQRLDLRMIHRTGDFVGFGGWGEVVVQRLVVSVMGGLLSLRVGDRLFFGFLL